MSDESKPPPLRLKPRLRPEEPAPADPATPPPAAPASSPAPEAPAFRLKPRLAAEPAAEPPAPEEKPSAPAAPPPPALPPESGMSPAPAAEAEAPKLKLKVKPPTPDEAHPAEPPPPPPAVEEPAEPPPPPEAPPPATPVPPPPPAPVVHLKAPGDMDEDKLAAKAAPAPVKKRPPRRLLVSLIGVVVLLGAGYFAWQKLTALPPPPVLNLHHTAPKPKTPAAPAGALNRIASLPGGMIDRAQDAIANRREAVQDHVDALAAGKDPLEAKTSPPPAPGKLTTVEAHAQTVIAPGLTATTVTTMSAVEAGAAFKSFVANLTINGVFQGTPSRVLINGHTFREGELIEPNLGVVFDHVDAARKQIIFKDRTGAIVERGY